MAKHDRAGYYVVEETHGVLLYVYRSKVSDDVYVGFGDVQLSEECTIYSCIKSFVRRNSTLLQLYPDSSIHIIAHDAQLVDHIKWADHAEQVAQQAEEEEHTPTVPRYQSFSSTVVRRTKKSHSCYLCGKYVDGDANPENCNLLCRACVSMVQVPATSQEAHEIRHGKYAVLQPLSADVIAERRF